MKNNVNRRTWHVYRIGARHVPIPYARNLERAALPDEERILTGLRAAVG